MQFRPLSTFRPVYAGGAVAIQENILATSYEDAVVICDFASGSELARVTPDSELITSLAISPDLAYLAVATRSFQIHIINLETFKVQATLHKAHESAIMALAWDPTSTLVASGGAEGVAKVWDVAQKYSTHSFKGHGGVISALKFYGKVGGSDWRLFSASDDAKVRVFDLVKSKLIKVLDNHHNVVRGIDVSSDGDWAVSGGRDKVLSFWHQYNLKVTVPVMAEVEACGFFNNQFFAATPSAVLLYSLDGQQVAKWDVPGYDEEELMLIDTLKAGDCLLAVLSDQTLVQLDSSLATVKLFAGNHGEIIDAVYSKDKLVIATNSAEIRVLQENPYEFKPLLGHSDVVIAIDVLGDWLVSAGKDKQVKLWNLKTGECMATFTGHAGSVGAVALSRGGSVPKFVLSGSEDLTIKKWSPDGSAEYTRKAHDKDINTIDVSQDNKLFLTGSQDKLVKVWDLETGETRGVLRGHKRGIWNARFGTNNTAISGSGDKTVRLWDLTNFTCLRTFEGHANSVLKVLYYQNSIASAGGDGLVKVWDPKSNECVATLDNHEEKVWSLTQNNGHLVSASGDSVITVWEDYTEQQKQEDALKHEQDVEKQQELENSVRNKQWHRAIELALDLNHPFRLLKLFADVRSQAEEHSISGVVAVDQVLASLHGKRLLKLLERVRDWNTNSSKSLVAQTVLAAVLQGHKVDELKDAQIVSVLKGIVPYSKRHMTRLEEMLETTYSLDYALLEMSK